MLLLFILFFNFWVLGLPVDGTGTRDTRINGNLDMTVRDSSGGGVGGGSSGGGGGGGGGEGSSGGDTTTCTGVSLGVENCVGGMLEAGMNCFSFILLLLLFIYFLIFGL